MEKLDLISKYKEDGELKIKELVVDYSSYIYQIIRNMTIYLSNEDIEEIILDVFIAVWKNKEKLKGHLPIKPYLVGITKNTVMNKCKNVKITYNLDDYENSVEDFVDMQVLLEQKEKNTLIRNALELMPPIDKNVFILFYYNSKSIHEIAKQFNLSETNIKTKLHRIRKKMKKILNEGGY